MSTGSGWSKFLRPNMTFRNIFCLLAASCFVPFSGAAEKFNPKDFRTDASFELVVSNSKYLKPGTSRIRSQSAFVSLVHGLVPGNSDGLEVMFFAKPITKANLPDVLNNEAGELRKSDYAALVLFLDKGNKVSQVNLSYVVPGTTVARTVAWKPDELKQHFSDLTFKNGRLIVGSTGSYSEAGQEALTLTWNIKLDLPVMREVKR
jgi:hypothetical protein